MEIVKVEVDDGRIGIEICGNVGTNGILSFNPTDFNLYGRFVKFCRELPDIEKRFFASSEPRLVTGHEKAEMEEISANLEVVNNLDAEIKERLNDVFRGNDFGELLSGVNLMAFGKIGNFVITNLLDAIRPYIESGVQTHLDKAADKAKLKRERRRAIQGGRA